MIFNCKHNVSGKKNIVFRKFSRKKYAAFNTLHKVVRISSLLVCYTLLSNPRMSAQSDSFPAMTHVSLEEVEVVGQKSPMAAEDLPRMVSVITKTETDHAPAHDISDLLRYASGIDIRQRGKDGLQSDVSIRGGSFDHSLILLNGINISDPQTGHYSLFTPLEPDIINRVEILNGPAARVYGANAFSGAIHFVVIPEESNSIKIGSGAGQYQFFKNYCSLNLGSKNFRNLLSLGHSTSQGYAPNTDFTRYNIYYKSFLRIDDQMIDFQFAHAKKAFGASSYYSPKYPDQFEQNDLTLLSASYKTGKKIKFKSEIYWRRMRDRFELFREDDAWYRIENGITISNDTNRTTYDSISWYKKHNHHINDVFGAQTNLHFNTFLGVSTVGWHIKNDHIISTNIGNKMTDSIPVRGYENIWYTLSDERTQADLFFEQRTKIKSLLISAGALVNWNSSLPEEINIFPGIDIKYDIIRNLSFIASYNYALGTPTFTDLHYTDPVNHGNPNLKPYSQNSAEAGFRLNTENITASMVCFYNYGHDIIDWIWFSDVSVFRPVNIDTYTGKGLEASLSYHSPLHLGNLYPVKFIRLNYTCMDIRKDIPGDAVKYSNPRQVFSGMLQQVIVKNMILAWNFSFLDRQGKYLTYDMNAKTYTLNSYKPYFLADLRISYIYRWFTLFCDITNIMDAHYLDAGSIYQPGRWISAGFTIDIESKE